MSYLHPRYQAPELHIPHLTHWAFYLIFCTPAKLLLVDNIIIFSFYYFLLSRKASATPYISFGIIFHPIQKRRSWSRPIPRQSKFEYRPCWAKNRSGTDKTMLHILVLYSQAKVGAQVSHADSTQAGLFV